jgi:hypothetical protein
MFYLTVEIRYRIWLTVDQISNMSKDVICTVSLNATS